MILGAVLASVITVLANILPGQHDTPDTGERHGHGRLG